MWMPGIAATESLVQIEGGTIITADSTSHVKGVWVELVASTGFDVTKMIVWGHGTSQTSTNTAMLVDIGIGTSTNEKVLIADIPCGHSSFALDNGLSVFPISIPAGTRISARNQAVIASDTIAIGLALFGSTPWDQQSHFQVVDTMGTTSAASHGKLITGNSITEIIASTAEDYKALGWAADNADETSSDNAVFTMDILVGAGAAEKILVSDLSWRTSASERIDEAYPPKGILPIRLNIPSGSRLSVQRQPSDTDRSGITLYGFR